MTLRHTASPPFLRYSLAFVFHPVSWPRDHRLMATLVSRSDEHPPKEEPPERARPLPRPGFLAHLHPRLVPSQSLTFAHTLGLGGTACTLLILLFVSGLLQLLLYTPTPEQAYTSIEQMYNRIPLGGWSRNVHYWAANLLVLVSGLHLLRICLTGAIRRHHFTNWCLGLVLLFLILCASFSGYLLPWDQRAYWAVTTFTGLFAYVPLLGSKLLILVRGGNEVGTATLSTFFAIHIGLLPLGLSLLSLWHFWLIRKGGGITLPATPQQPKVAAFPYLVEREAAMGMGTVAVVLLLAALVDAPLAAPANPGMSPNPARATWYFLGLQELLLHFPPLVAFGLLPALMSLALILLPFYSGTQVHTQGIWCTGQRGRPWAVAAVVSGLFWAVVLVLVDDLLLRPYFAASPWHSALVLLVGYTCLLAGGWFLLWRKRLPYAFCIMASVLFHFGLLLGLSCISGWFRGPGMSLDWPSFF